ncbi:MAG: hypothetical protein FRX49_06220 [Trebouxia sp. A1-2]|nr:MAG: hypothetical protein FRX49_06220 [Trebouxia sp. A1-2]
MFIYSSFLQDIVYHLLPPLAGGGASLSLRNGAAGPSLLGGASLSAGASPLAAAPNRRGGPSLGGPSRGAASLPAPRGPPPQLDGAASLAGASRAATQLTVASTANIFPQNATEEENIFPQNATEEEEEEEGRGVTSSRARAAGGAKLPPRLLGGTKALPAEGLAGASSRSFLCKRDMIVL